MIVSRVALIPIGIQRGFDDPAWQGRTNPDLEQNGIALLAAWRERSWPIFHIRHDSLRASSPLHPRRAGNAFREGFEPCKGEFVISKSLDCAFTGTDLEGKLRWLCVKQVVLFGFTIDMGVSTSARIASILGFETVVVSDASCAFRLITAEGKEMSGEAIESAHLATLNAEFAEVISTQSLISSLPTPKAIQIHAEPYY